jgi:hypothetical protein
MRLVTTVLAGGGENGSEEARVTWELCDEDQEVIELPSYMSKFSLYNKYLKELELEYSTCTMIINLRLSRKNWWSLTLWKSTTLLLGKHS